jgi:hypothetical protein
MYKLNERNENNTINNDSMTDGYSLNVNTFFINEVIDDFSKKYIASELTFLNGIFEDD